MKDTHITRLGASNPPCFSCDGTGAFDLFADLPCQRCHGTGVYENDGIGPNLPNSMGFNDDALAYLEFRALVLLPLRKVAREAIQKHRTAKEAREQRQDKFPDRW